MSSSLDSDLSGANRPNFGSMAAEPFEYLCLDIARANFENVLSGDLHERGTAQHGVDFLVETKGLGLIAGSCRSDENPKRRRIIGAAEEFAAAWEEVWKPQSVKRFILCLACEARTQARKKAVSDAREIILGLGIACEVWTQSDLIDRLRPHPSVVVQHLDQNWARKLCVSETLNADENNHEMLASFEQRISAYKASQAPLMQSKMDEIARLTRQGARRTAEEEASKLKTDASLWRVASSEQKATILRTQVVGEQGVVTDRVRQAYSAASKIHSPKDRYYDLRILAAEIGADAAIDALGVPRTSRERTLKAGFYLEAGAPGDALITLRGCGTPVTLPAWNYRVEAIAHAMMGDFDAAIQAADAAVSVAPDDLVAKQTRAAIYFNATIAPGVGFLGITANQPYARALVREDNASAQRRRKSVEWFEEIMATAPEAEDREAAWLWTFIAALDDPKRRADVASLVASAREAGCLSPSYLNWVLMRGLPANLDAEIKWLKARLDQDPGDVTAAASLYFVERQTGDTDKLRHLLDTYKVAFDRMGDAQVEGFKAQIRELEAAREGAIALLEPPSEDEIAAYFRDASMDVSGRIQAARQLAEAEQWDLLLSERSFLLDEATSPVSFEIVAHAIASTQGPKEALEFFEAHRTEYLAEPLKPGFLRMYIGFLANAGRIADALALCETAYTDPSDPEYLMRAQFQFRLGSLRGAGIIVRRAFQADNPALSDAEMLMRWANTLKADDPKTSILLLDGSFDRDPDAAVGCGASFLALQLVPERAEPFMQRMHAYALAHPNGSIRLASFEEAKDWMISSIDGARRSKELYAKGQIFGHAVFGEKLGLIYLTPLESHAHFDGILPQIAHGMGGRARSLDIEEVILDSTAILVAEVLGLWESLDRAEIKIVLPDGWSASLAEFERAAQPNQSDRVDARQSIVEAVASGSIDARKRRPAGTVRICFEGEASEPTDFVDVKLDDETIDRLVDAQSHVFVDDGVAESLMVSGALQKLMGKVRICISNRQFVDISGEARVDANGAAIAARIKSLRTRLSADLRTGRLEQSPAVLDSGLEDDDGAVDYAMRSGLRYRSNRKAVLWFDDRFMNGHVNGPHHPIVGVRTILCMLQARGVIDEKQVGHFEQRLRDLGFDFVLPSADEVYHALREDWNHTHDATPRLEAMRRTFDRFSTQQSSVFGPLGAHAVDERQAAFEQYLLASHVVQRILDDSLGSRDLDLSAISWVLEEFRLDWRKEVSADSAKQICAMWHGSVVLAFLTNAARATDARRAEFKDILDSVYRHIVKPAIEVNSGGLEAFTGRIASVIEGHLEDLLGGDLDTIESQVGLRLVSSFLDICPDEIESLLCENPVIASALQITKAVGISGHVFRDDGLWSAVDALIELSEPVERIDEDGNRIVFSRMDDVHIQAETEEKIYPKVIHPAVGGVRRESRRMAFDQMLQDLRLCKSDATWWRRRFGQARSAERRAELLDELRNSPEGRLNRLVRLEAGDRVHFDQLSAPPFEETWRWLNGDVGQGADLKDGIPALVEQVGVQEAVLRWSGVPLPLPEEVLTLTNELPRESLMRLREQCVDPVARRSLLQIFRSHPDAQDHVEALKALIGEEPSDLRTAQLYYADAVSLRINTQVSPKVSREKIWVCAWAWTGRVFSRLIGRHAALADLSNQFLQSQKTNRLALRAHLQRSDMLDPGKVNSVQFLAGLGGRWLEGESDARTEDALAALAKEISFPGVDGLPHPSILTVALQPNAYQSWLGKHPNWVIDLLDSEDTTVNRLLLDRETYVDELFDAPRLSMPDMLMIGVADLNTERTKRLLFEAGQAVQRSDLVQVQNLASLLLSLSPEPDALKDKTLYLFKMILQRGTSLIGDSTDKVDELHFLLEIGLRLVLKNKPNDTGAVFEMLAFYTSAVSRKYAGELAAFIRLVADTFPIGDRAPFLELAARQAGAPFQ